MNIAANNPENSDALIYTVCLNDKVKRWIQFTLRSYG